MSRLTESDDVFIWVTSEHENPKFIKQCYLKLAAYEDIGEPEELTKLKERLEVCERALKRFLEELTYYEVNKLDKTPPDYEIARIRKCFKNKYLVIKQQAEAEIEKEKEG